MICSNIIMQGDEFFLPIKIKIDGENIDLNKINTIQFMIGDLVKYYKNDNSGEITYNQETNEFYFPLSQEETFNMSGSQEAQIRIKYESGEIQGANIGVINILYSKTKETI